MVCGAIRFVKAYKDVGVYLIESNDAARSASDPNLPTSEQNAERELASRLMTIDVLPSTTW